MQHCTVILLLCIAMSFLTVFPLQGEENMNIPDDFPHFLVPGFDKEMNLLRTLFWLHYPKTGPGATLWDEWMSAPALWPAVTSDNQLKKYTNRWNEALSNRIIDPEGYVATHQHASITHQLGWPFPFWYCGAGSAGWHFSFKDTVPEPWRPNQLSTQEGWILKGAQDAGINEVGWTIRLTEPKSMLQQPEKSFIIDVYQAPFFQIRWLAPKLRNAQPYIEWITDKNTVYSQDRRMYFDAPDDDSMVYTMIPLYKHSEWKDKVTQFRICFGNTATDIPVTIQALFTNYDTRHNVNAQSFIRGCANYFWWTGDLEFLRKNINRMRSALRYMMTEHRTLDMNIVFTDWVGHEGRTGLEKQSDGTNKLLPGNGIGNNYWDLLPFGYKDTYATLRYYDTVKVMEKIEREIESHPSWNMPLGILKCNPEMLSEHAASVKKTGNEMFWNPATGRFVAAIDIDGTKWDYGFTFVNLEAIHYDFATKEHADAILKWISGERIVDGDTSQGVDIYHWRFAPRSTTKRNIEYYVWVWTAPESIPWGGQVQDGGAVLGFSYHDLMARLRVRGADDCWKRLQAIIAWFDEVQDAGGYREYYKDKKDVSLQGGGTAGGLGLDFEFVESILVPQIMIDGFLGFTPGGDGFALNPQLPTEWQELSIDRIHFHDMILTVKATKARIDISREGTMDVPCHIYLPEGAWDTTSYIDDKDSSISGKVKINNNSPSAVVDWQRTSRIIFERE